MDDLIIWILCTLLTIIGLLNLCFLCFRGRISEATNVSPPVTRANVPIISSPIRTVSQGVATADSEQSQSNSVNIIPPSYATLMRCRDLDDLACKSSYDATESSALSTTEASTVTSDSNDGLAHQEDRFMCYFLANNQLAGINCNFMATQVVRHDDESSLNEDTLTIDNTTARSPASDQLLSSL